MSISARIAREISIGSSRLSASPLASRTPGRQIASLLGNHGVPALAKWAFKPGVQQVNNVRLMIPDGLGTGAGGEHHMAIGTYERGETAFVLSNMSEGNWMIDVGAHVGYFAIAAAAKVGTTGGIIAVEPTESSAEVLRENVRLNGFEDRVHVIEKAASDHAGGATFYVSDTSSMWNSVEPGTLDDSTRTLEVATTTIDDLVSEVGWPSIRILKIDVEGHEVSVMRGASETLARNPELNILFEVSGTSEERIRVSLDTILYLADEGFGFCSIDVHGRLAAEDVESLTARMRRPRWQDSLFNVVARRSSSLP